MADGSQGGPGAEEALAFQAAMQAVAVSAATAKTPQATSSSSNSVSNADRELRLWVGDAKGKIRPRTIARIVDASGSGTGLRLSSTGQQGFDKVLARGLRVTAVAVVAIAGLLHARPAIQVRQCP